MIFEEKYNEYLVLVNAELENMIKISDIPEKRVLEAMKYSLTIGGKRIRPVLVLAFCELLGGNIKDALVVATAIECIHTYSLIHDDLPCMDNDDFRRGKPTCHKAFDEATAVLAGDGLLNLAFERLSDTKNFEGVNSDRLLKIIKYIGNCSGSSGMIAGQTVDLALENTGTCDIELIRYLHERKTGALIRCSAVSGALTGDFDDKDISFAEEYALNLGLAFQIKDDILDFEGDEALLGKPIGSDAENGKSTYVSVLGIERAKELLSEYTEKAVFSLSEYGEKAEFLIQLSNYLLNRNM